MTKDRLKAKSPARRFWWALSMLLMCCFANAQNLTQEGTIVDKNNEPLIGVSVQVKGGTVGTVTDADGFFSLKCNKGDKLVVKYIGYEEQELKATGTALRVTLQDNSQSLNEIVVVGYGVQKKANLTGAVSAVKGEEIQARPLGDITQALQGLVPGLTISSPSAGTPGASSTITLRGQGNLSGTGTPYVLVDGVEMNLSDVNPNDVENISVLKDAAACAIYGARAAYGVILVTTKKGEGGKVRLNYNGNVGWSAPTVLPKMVDSYTFAKYWNDGVTNAGSTRLYSDSKLELLRQYCENPSSVDPWQELPPNHSMNPAFENSESGIGNTDYFGLHYKNWAFKQKHTVSLSGDTKVVQYYVSGGFYKEDGILRFADMGFKRFNVNASFTAQMTKWLKASVKTKFMNSTQDTPFGDGGLSYGFFHSLARFRPTVCDIDPNGHYTELTMIPYLQSGTYTQNKKNNFNITANLQAQPVKNWFINVDATLRHSNADYTALNVAPKIYAADGVTTSLGLRSELDVAKDGKYTAQKSNTHYYTINVYTNYSIEVAKHSISALVGFQTEDWSTSLLKNSITGLYSTSNPNVADGTGDKVVYDARSSWATLGVFGRINYDYDGRYLVEFNCRYDGSSRFAKGHRWGFFPSVSVGWNLHNEKFMENTRTWLSNLKIRGSYGILGNQAGAATYAYIATMQQTSGLGSYIYPDGRHTYTQAPGVANPNTTWEKVNSANIGIDFGFFGNRLTGSFDIFQRDTKDMLGPGEDYPDFFGATAPQTNNANMRNRGWELAINWRGTIGKEISYSVGASISDATAEVTKYQNPTGNNPAGEWYVGKKVGEIWGYKSSGLIQTQAEADEFNKLDLSYLSSSPWTPGDVRYIDINGDGKINKGKNVLGDMGDLTVIGNTTPRYNYTFNGSISWKGLSLSAMFQGVGKRDYWADGVYFWGWGPYAQVTVFPQHLDYWTESNTDAYYPKPYIHSAGGVGPYQNKNKQVSDRYLQSAAYLRLKTLTLSYDIPQYLLKRIGISRLQVYFTGENLFTTTKLAAMFDPEGIFSSNSYTSEGGKNYPMNKVVSVGLVFNL